jgi:putative colanic acid biosynthesis UDP-glucose lipid carrier transferase
MAESLVFKSRISLTLYSLQAVWPAAVADLSLYLTMALYGVTFDSNYLGLITLVTALSLLLIRPTQVATGEPLAEWAERVVHVMGRWALLLAALLLLGYASKSSATFSRRVVLTWAIVTPFLLVLTNYWLHRLITRVLADPANARQVVFVGVNEVSKALAERLQQNAGLGMSVAGFFDDRSAERMGMAESVPLLGRLFDLPPYVKEHGIDAIFIALPIRHVQRVMDLVDEMRDTTVSIYYAPDIFVFDLIQAKTLDIAGIPVIAMLETPFSGYRGVLKRMFDFACSIAMLPVLVPVMLTIAVLVRVSSPGPVLFRQRRYGLDGLEIAVYKFRTMTVTEDGPQIAQATRNDPRVTPIGRILRRYSLDELPQLLNVLQGRMSLVGPRPHAVAHNEQYRKLIKGYMVRHKVLPGITGWAQVNGYRGETAELGQMQARVEYDLEYLRRWSPLLDLRILLITAWQILRDGGRAY